MTWLSALLIAILSLTCAGLAHAADPFGELFQGPRARLKDFGRYRTAKTKSLLSPQGEVVIPAGTDLNTVFDLHCLARPPGKGEGRSWIAAQVRVPKTRVESAKRRRPGRSRLHSVTWTLPVEIGWKKLEEIAGGERCLQAIAPDVEIRVMSASWLEDPYIAQQDHLDFIIWPRSIARFADVLGRVPPTVIAVVDTGVDLTHPDLAPNAWVNPREIPGNGRDDDFNGYVDDVNGFDFSDYTANSGPKSDDPYFRHGTHVAGLAAARAGNSGGGAGVHAFSNIMSLNVFGSSRTARVSNLENALRYAADNGAGVVNLSVGGREYTSTMEHTLRYVVRRGTVVIAATGNEGIEISRDPLSPRFVTPAVYARDIEGMLSVTSVDVRSGTLSSFANFGMFLVELAAPGAFRSGPHSDGLLSTLPGGGYGWLSGTSMAAPLVSGAAGLTQAWLRATGGVSGGVSDAAKVERLLIESARPSDKILGFTRYGKIVDLERLASALDGSLTISASESTPPKTASRKRF